MALIEDGKGRGYIAEVDDHGRLYVRSNTVSHMSHHASALHRNAFMGVMTTTLAGTAETPCAIVSNNSTTQDLEIYWFRVSADADVEIKIYVKSAYTSGGVQFPFINTNLSLDVIGTEVAYEGGPTANLVLDTANEKEVDGFYLAANDKKEIMYEGGVVITPNKSIVVKAIGANTNNVKVMMGYAIHSANTPL